MSSKEEVIDNCIYFISAIWNRVEIDETSARLMITALLKEAGKIKGNIFDHMNSKLVTEHLYRAYNKTKSERLATIT